MDKEHTRIIEVGGVAFSYRSKSVIDDIEFALKRNEVLSILGPNGVGKTTLLKCMNAILKPKEGSILVEEEVLLIRCSDPSPGEWLPSGLPSREG